MPGSEELTEIDWLEHDLGLLKSLVRRHGRILKPLADSSDPPRHNYFETIASLYWACLDYGEGALRLIQSENRAALIPVQRSLLEAAVNLRYLAGTEEPVREAAVRKAYALRKELAWPIAPEGKEERVAILARMPEEVTEVAKRREKKGRGWTGKSWKSLLEIGGFSSYDAYGFMAEHSHSSALYSNVAWERTEGQRQLRLGYRLSDIEAEHAANFTRRLLFMVHEVFWTSFGGPAEDMPSSDPFVWLDGQIAADRNASTLNGT